ncbi:hypothetical protein ACOMHN_029427 [Nucella lapillus]
MVSECGKQVLSLYSHRHCFLSAVLLLGCATLVYLLWLFSSDSFGSRHALIWSQHRDDSAAPFMDFIDPDLSYLKRMFYSGGLVTGQSHASAEKAGGEKGDPGSAPHNVTVFTGREDYHQYLNACVPFHVPGNRTLRICVYEREKDKMISSYLRDYGVWEKEQVEGMVSLLLRDDADLGRRLGSQALEEEGLRHETSRSKINHRLIMSPSAMEEEEERRVWNQALKEEGLRHDTNRSETHHRLILSPSEEEEEGKEERAEARRMRRLSVVDVGCNVGVYTLAAASQGHKVLAVDPLESNLQLLHNSLVQAGLREHVTLLLNALADRPGPVRVRLNPSNIGGSSVSHTRARGAPAVWALCLDHLVPLVPTGRLLLKLDIEGWEARVLRCGAEFFQRLDVRYVVMEWLFLRNSRSGADVVDFLVRNGLLPYTDVTQTTFLSPGRFHSWPDNVWWIKR